MTAVVHLSCQQPLMGPQQQLGVLMHPSCTTSAAPAPSTSTDSGEAGLEKVKLRVGFGGEFLPASNGQGCKYVGGNWHLDSVPLGFKYTDLAYRLTEKVEQAVAIKYLPPGDLLDVDNLIGVWDDADVQEMYEEYTFAIQHVDIKGRPLRLLVFLFAASEDGGYVHLPEEREEHAGGYQFLEPGGHAMGGSNSLDSSYSAGAGDAGPLHVGGLDGFRASIQGLPGIANNPFVAPWHTPGSEETSSGLSTAMQKHLSVSGKPPSGPQDMSVSQAMSSGAGANKENSMAMHLPTHLSIFGDTAPQLPSHISVFGDSCNLRMQPPAAIVTPRSPPALVGQQPGLAAQAGWDHKSHSPEPAASSWNSPSWSQLLSTVPHVPKSGVRITGVIAEGAFGQVVMAKTPQFCEVAIKWIKPGKMDQHLGAFWREAQLLSRLNHPNVLRMYGVVCESEADPTIRGIMTEYASGGSLSANLRSCNACLPLLLRAQLALQIASGMAFLHEQNVVHFDLKPDNILLDRDLRTAALEGQRAPCVKVADFGLSKEKRQSYVSGVRDLRGTLPFIAPELVNDPDRVTEMADVWSMGMLMWELLTLTSPFQDMLPQAIISGLMKGTLRPVVPEWCEPSWHHLMRSCWALDPAARPSFRCMALELEHLVELLSPCSPCPSS